MTEALNPIDAYANFSGSLVRAQAEYEALVTRLDALHYRASLAYGREETEPFPFLAGSIRLEEQLARAEGLMRETFRNMRTYWVAHLLTFKPEPETLSVLAALVAEYRIHAIAAHPPPLALPDLLDYVERLELPARSWLELVTEIHRALLEDRL